MAYLKPIAGLNARHSTPEATLIAVPGDYVKIIAVCRVSELNLTTGAMILDMQSEGPYTITKCDHDGNPV